MKHPQHKFSDALIDFIKDRENDQEMTSNPVTNRAIGIIAALGLALSSDTPKLFVAISNSVMDALKENSVDIFRQAEDLGVPIPEGVREKLTE